MANFPYQHDLASDLSDLESKGVFIKTSAGFREAARKARDSGKKVVATTGVFDLLHISHMTLLINSKVAFPGSAVFFSFDTDAWSLKRKGQLPIVPEGLRAMNVLLASQGMISHFGFHGSAEELARTLKAISPDILFGGPNYLGLSEQAQLIGATPQVVPTKYGISTTSWSQFLYDRLKNRFAPEA